MSAAGGGAGFAARARHELASYAIAALYLFFCLGAVRLHEDAVLPAEGVRLLPIGVALG